METIVAKSKKKKTQRFKFRAEDQWNVFHAGAFIRARCEEETNVTNEHVFAALVYFRRLGRSEVETTWSSNLTLAQFREALTNFVGDDVMAETLALGKNYSGRK